MTDEIVCNASPIIGLAHIGQLELLRDLFGTVIVPTAVVSETAPSVNLPSWIMSRALVQTIGPRILGAYLGRGESEAISLALECNAKLVILDDRPARRLAQSLGLNVIGTTGLLLAAKERGLIPDVKPHLDQLLEFDFYIASKLYEQVLKAAEEA